MQRTIVRLVLVLAVLGTTALFAGPVAADATADVSVTTTVNGQTNTVGVDATGSQDGGTATLQVNDQEQTVAVP